MIRSGPQSIELPQEAMQLVQLAPDNAVHAAATEDDAAAQLRMVNSTIW